MRDNFKTFTFLKFDFLNRPLEDTELKCNIELSAQSPKDSTVNDRAIFISFSANTDNDIMHIAIQMRIVYSFEEGLIPDEQQFLDEYYLDAYEIFKTKVNDVFTALGEDSLPFPEAQ